MIKHLTITLLLTTGVALAQNTVSEQVKFLQTQALIKTDTAGGKVVEIVLPNPKAVMPGDTLREETIITNVSGTVLKGVQVTVPVPRSTEFSGQASVNTRWTLLYSADNGQSYSAVPTLNVTTTENGKTVNRKVSVPASKYTNVRWVVTTLKPDESLKLSFRVKVK